MDLSTVVVFFNMPPKAPPVWAPFTMIAEGCPEFSPLTPEGQVWWGGILLVPPERRHLVRVRPALCLPTCDRCIEYVEWFEQQRERPRGIGTMIMSNNDWVREFGYEAYRELISSLARVGRPTVHWRHMVYCNTPDDE